MKSLGFFASLRMTSGEYYVRPSSHPSLRSGSQTICETFVSSLASFGIADYVSDFVSDMVSDLVSDLVSSYHHKYYSGLDARFLDEVYNALKFLFTCCGDVENCVFAYALEGFLMDPYYRIGKLYGL